MREHSSVFCLPVYEGKYLILDKRPVLELSYEFQYQDYFSPNSIRVIKNSFKITKGENKIPDILLENIKWVLIESDGTPELIVPLISVFIRQPVEIQYGYIASQQKDDLFIARVNAKFFKCELRGE